jgi:DNA sulfur modification protein DndC
MSNLTILRTICGPSSHNTLTKSCRSCLHRPGTVQELAIQVIRDEYLRGDEPWFLGFSGGKDSSAVLKLTYEAMRRVAHPERPVTVVYCDTMVEIPVVAGFVRSTLRRLAKEAKADNLPLRVKLARPPIGDRFFVKVIGRGYPPPTNKFRWCTDRLRIDPVRRVIGQKFNERAIVLLGTRSGESYQRDRTLARQTLEGAYYFRQVGNPNVRLFAPIVDFSTSDVWTTLFNLPLPTSLDTDRLFTLYQDAGAECPIIKDPNGTPCGTGRFGCWTCTVVRRDKAVSSMVTEGHAGLEPLLEFRNWLAKMRDDPTNRCRFRRNGVKGLGPLTLSARKTILRRLLAAESAAARRLIGKSEVTAIKALWKMDLGSSTYRE